MTKERILDEESRDVEVLLGGGTVVHTVTQQLLHNHRIQHQTAVLYLPSIGETPFKSIHRGYETFNSQHESRLVKIILNLDGAI